VLLVFLLAACGGGGGASEPTVAVGFTISGSILAASGSIADGDVNDIAAPYVSNDTVSTAQDIPNPATIGGYVNRPGSGQAGRSQLPGDLSDIYKASLAVNQTIRLIIGDSSAPNDLDLLLMDADGNLVSTSEGVGNTEIIVAPSSGTFLIEVYAYGGASNYVLTVGQASPATATDTLSVLEDFVPGEIVVRFNDENAARSVRAAGLTARVGEMGLTARAGAPGRETLLSLGDGEQRENAARLLKIKPLNGRLPVLMQQAAVDPDKVETIRAIKALRRQPDIKYASPNYIYKPLLTPNDHLYSLQWHYPLVNLPQAWDVATGSTNVIVAVIDSGVLLAHPDLQGQLTQGYDFISNAANALDGDGIDDNPDDPGDGGSSGNSGFHGTHVAGTIAAATNNATGVSGVAWSASLMPLRALGKYGGTSYDINQAVRYAAGLSNDSGTLPPRRADVINLSLGGFGYSQLSQDVITQARNQGVVIVAAAGNEASYAATYPASYGGVVSVSAVDINKDKAPYSNAGSTVDVAAPGGDITQDINGDANPDGVVSTWADDSSGTIQMIYGISTGTSMAAAHVAGIVALMKAVNPALAPATFDTLLATGQLTEDLGSPGRDDVYGYGLIDAHKAVVAAGGSPALPNLVASPAALNFGTTTTALSLILANGGGGVLTVNTPTDDAPWLSVQESKVDINNNGTYSVAVDRAGMSVGLYAATVTITSSANTVSVPVIMQVSSTSIIADAGLQHVLLVDSETGDTVARSVVGVENGRYSYSFSQVPGGTYRILSGSDSNNDGVICDAGESCGAYLTLDQPAEISVAANRALADFSTSYLSGIAALSR